MNKFISKYPEHENDNNDIIKKVLRKSLDEMLNVDTYNVSYSIPGPTNAESEIIAQQPLTINEWLNA